MSTFKIVLTSIFAVSIVIGIALFAMSKGASNAGSANLTVWGTIPSDVFNKVYENSSLKQNKLITVTYVKKDPTNFDTDFVNALADGKGPDIVILRDDFFYKHRNRLFIIPYKNYTERNFRDTFADEASDIFLSASGVIALPIMIDPLVLYWNKDMFSNNLIVNPPKYWEEIYAMIDKMTRKNSSAVVTQSALAMGEWRNINNAKEILATLLMQAGTPIISRSSSSADPAIALNSQFNYPMVPSQSAVNFYTQFSNPTSPTYAWNRSLPTSLNFFLSGNLAMYLGFASEIYGIQQKNANLNFDVTNVPQVKGAEKNVVFAHMYGAAIVKQSKQIGASFTAINAFTEPSAIKAIETATALPPVRKDLLQSKPSDAFRTVFYNSAIISHGWIDPDSAQSANIFRDMIESITSGQSRVTDALSGASDELEALLK